MIRVFDITKIIKLLLITILIFLTINTIFIYSKLAVDVINQKKLLPIYCVDRNDKKIALTFDAAWGNDDTKELLSILKKYNAKATFFLVGFWVEKYPEDVKDIFSQGHEIGSHSDKHLHMSRLSESEIIKDIKSCEEKIIRIIHKKPTVFRPPYGDYNNTLIKTLSSLGYYVIQWDVDSLDWKDLSAQDIAQRVLKRVKSGSIVLFHNNAKNTKYALPIILNTLTKQGYEFVTVSELIYKDGYYIDHQGVQKRIIR
ncbi:polysaccharide deacetylase family sporulation protein PdaB [Anaerocellum diazotrophicum]|uniref:Polysaccharide deacetylase family sporulation protein PdaB n=1 Tax=Caldicellulosiruptor diazotrophicus TaxID=2806205 RepID=A0ABN6E6W8_9FIRM|nr:polysaccharide deacetylase family sporulation protein PdaB [Caldicellulosiruptor diazotrophicus]BCS81097.1 polysaccharide deacetylase family sporulation protein PdaB [Caldicellulosiruptor diazotrophicus]